MDSVKLCKDCKWSDRAENHSYNLRCENPQVNAKDPWALSSEPFAGSVCSEERAKKWFAACGMKGKLWESNATQKVVDALKRAGEQAGKLYEAATAVEKQADKMLRKEPFCWYKQCYGDTGDFFYWPGEKRPDDAIPLYKKD